MTVWALRDFKATSRLLLIFLLDSGQKDKINLHYEIYVYNVYVYVKSLIVMINQLWYQSQKSKFTFVIKMFSSYQATKQVTASAQSLCSYVIRFYGKILFLRITTDDKIVLGRRRRG